MWRLFSTVHSVVGLLCKSVTVLAGCFAFHPRPALHPCWNHRWRLIVKTSTPMVRLIPKHRRVLFQFFLTIGLPCLSLGYLAFRGVQNDWALREEESNAHCLALARDIISALDDSLTAIEEQSAAFYADLEAKGQGTVIARLDSLHNFLPLTQAVFFVDTAGRIQGNTAAALYQDEILNEGGAVVPSIAAVPEAEEAEFQRNDLPVALESYHKAAAEARDPADMGVLLIQQARVQRKLSLYAKALTTYEEILRRSPDGVIAGGVPLAVVAHRESGMTALEQGDSARGVETLLLLFEDFATGGMMMAKSVYINQVTFLDSTIEDLVDSSHASSGHEPARARYLIARQELSRRRRATESLLALNSIGFQTFIRQYPHNPGGARKGWIRESVDLADQPSLVCLTEAPPLASESLGTFLGFIIGARRLGTVLFPAIVARCEIPADTYWSLFDSHGDVICDFGSPGPSPVIARLDLRPIVPQWFLEVHRKSPEMIGLIFGEGRSIYGYYFALIGVVLIFGFGLTLRSVTHELSLANLKYDFVSTVSHEFKSPLTSVRQLGEMLRMGRVPSETRRQQYYDVIVEQSERLSVLIENVLDYAKMEDGKGVLDFEALDIVPLLRTIIAHVQHQVDHANFLINVEMPEQLPSVRADRLAIAQAFTNLLDNALKYSGTSTRIDVSAFSDGIFVMVSIRDFGVGIAKKDLKKIFDRFYRGGDPHNRPVGGTGLGLTLVSHVVRAHGGRVFVQSEPGKGSTFTVRLPICSMYRRSILHAPDSHHRR
jgi:signal transduction histidine kinase/tetratricopeptide (TPR) repeat protein